MPDVDIFVQGKGRFMISLIQDPQDATAEQPAFAAIAHGAYHGRGRR